MVLKKSSKIVRGHSFRGKIEEHEDGNVLAISAKNISDITGLSLEEAKKTKLEITDRIQELLLKEGDILCMTTGPRVYSCVVKNLPSNNILPTSHLTIIRVSDSQIDPEFLSWFINNDINAQEYFLKNSQGRAVSTLGVKALEDLPVLIPDMAIQKDIAKLDSLVNEESILTQKLLENRRVLATEFQRNLLLLNEK